MTVTQLLEAALAELHRIDGTYMRFCESGGYSVDCEWERQGAVGKVKELLALFVDPQAGLPAAIQASIAGQPIDWESAACWEELRDLRAALDRLPEPTDRSSQHARVTFDDQTRAIVLDGIAYPQPNKPKIAPRAYVYFRFLVDSLPHARTDAEFKAKYPSYGKPGDFIKELPEALRKCIVRKPSAGSTIELPDLTRTTVSSESTWFETNHH
jgi:hypothetical protein